MIVLPATENAMDITVAGVALVVLLPGHRGTVPAVLPARELTPVGVIS